MSVLAIIGGTGLSKLVDLDDVHKRVIKTPYGEPSSALTFGTLNGVEVVFLARHGYGHTIPPHKINYQANIWALKEAGATNIVAVAAVGSMNQTMPPASLVLPNQLIDYTWGRSSTYFEEDLEHVVHIDFTNPYSTTLRDSLITAMADVDLPVLNKAVYACTQGPRLETAAEVVRLERDGCDLVGMTGMPEAGLARELKLNYACCAVVVNWAAGLEGDEISMDKIEAFASKGMDKVHRVLTALVL
ncbi:MAG TPA: S-methyl-5'-thioinosine phosphorylase [Cycloclasticus sp.]|jgi:5'-deoxy-5'-methylthioadenosine phosphorylase|nr:S-methyl-5'-thioinosine phosphorylase [Cycloclasticus sp.]HIL91395.1 S-methyl-5'-thioinosine phosphorylase [Cycloclasticus sp.]